MFVYFKSDDKDAQSSQSQCLVLGRCEIRQSKFHHQSTNNWIEILSSIAFGVFSRLKEHYQKFLDGEEEILYIAKEDDPLVYWRDRSFV